MEDEIRVLIKELELDSKFDDDDLKFIDEIKETLPYGKNPIKECVEYYKINQLPNVDYSLEQQELRRTTEYEKVRDIIEIIEEIRNNYPDINKKDFNFKKTKEWEAIDESIKERWNSYSDFIYSETIKYVFKESVKKAVAMKNLDLIPEYINSSYEEFSNYLPLYDPYQATVLTYFGYKILTAFQKVNNESRGLTSVNHENNVKELISIAKNKLNVEIDLQKDIPEELILRVARLTGKTAKTYINSIKISRKAQVAYIDDEIIEPQSPYKTPEQAYLENERAEILQAAIIKLNPLERFVINEMYDNDGITDAAISRKLIVLEEEKDDLIKEIRLFFPNIFNEATVKKVKNEALSKLGSDLNVRKYGYESKIKDRYIFINEGFASDEDLENFFSDDKAFNNIPEM